MNIYIEFTYLAASILFVFGLKGLTHPDSARRGMLLAAAGMTAAIGVVACAVPAAVFTVTTALPDAVSFGT